MCRAAFKERNESLSHCVVIYYFHYFFFSFPVALITFNRFSILLRNEMSFPGRLDVLLSKRSVFMCFS